MTDGPQRAVPPENAHPASLTFLPFIFGGNLHLLNWDADLFKKDHQVRTSSRWLPAASSTVIGQAPRRAAQRRLLTRGPALCDGLLGGGLYGDGRLEGVLSRCIFLVRVETVLRWHCTLASTPVLL